MTARIDKDGETWKLVLVREFSHPPAAVWQALTDPAELREWAPFDADRSLATTGATVKLTTVGAPAEQVSETKVTRAEAPHVLEYAWGGGDIRWELKPTQGGTRLTLWAVIPRPYIAMGAAGWHTCFDVLDRLLEGRRGGRRVGMELMKDAEWQRLHAEYSKQLGVEMPAWSR